MKGLKDFQKRVEEIKAQKAKISARINALEAEITRLNSEMDAALCAGDEERAMVLSDSITRKETELGIAQRVRVRRDMRLDFSDGDLRESWDAERQPLNQKVESAIKQVEKAAPELFRAYAAAGKIRNDALAVRDNYKSLLVDKNIPFAGVKQLPNIFPGESWRVWMMLVNDERAARTLAMIAEAQSHIRDYDEVMRKYL